MIKDSPHWTMDYYWLREMENRVLTAALEDFKSGRVKNEYEGQWRGVYDEEVRRLKGSDESITV